MKITKSTLSNWLAPFSRLVGIGFLVVNAVLWLNPEWVLIPAQAFSGLTESQYTLTAMNRGLGFLVSSLHIAVLVYGLFAVAQVFRDFASGQWFVPQFSKLLRRFGTALIVFSLLTPIVQMLLSVILTFQNPEGERMVVLGFSGDHNAIIVPLTGILLVLIGTVLKEASRIADDNEKII